MSATTPTTLDGIKASEDYSAHDVARIAKVCTHTVYRWIRVGIIRDGITNKLHTVKVGGRLRIKGHDLLTFIYS